MTARIRTTREIEVPGYEDLWIAPDLPMPETHDEVWVSEPTDRGTIEVSWLVQDDDSHDFEWNDLGDNPEEWVNGVFKDFRSSRAGGGQEARDAFIAEATEVVGADNVFIVDVYSHGLEHYSVANTVNYPDRRWDVAPACVLVVPPDVTNPREWADGQMDEYSKWAMGDVWGVCVVEVNPTTGEVVRGESVWGHIGREYAEETARTFGY